jgi:hypothetical protein
MVQPHASAGATFQANMARGTAITDGEETAISEHRKGCSVMQELKESEESTKRDAFVT